MDEVIKLFVLKTLIFIQAVYNHFVISKNKMMNRNRQNFDKLSFVEERCGTEASQINEGNSHVSDDAYDAAAIFNQIKILTNEHRSVMGLRHSKDYKASRQ